MANSIKYNTSGLNDGIYVAVGFDGKDYLVAGTYSLRVELVKRDIIAWASYCVPNIIVKENSNWVDLVGVSLNELELSYKSAKDSRIITVIKEYINKYTNKLEGYAVVDSKGNVMNISIDNLYNTVKDYKITNGLLENNRIVPVGFGSYMYSIVSSLPDGSKGYSPDIDTDCMADRINEFMGYGVYKKLLTEGDIKLNIAKFKQAKELEDNRIGYLEIYGADTRCTYIKIKVESKKQKGNVRYIIYVKWYNEFMGDSKRAKYDELLSCDDFYITGVHTNGVEAGFKILYKDSEIVDDEGNLKEVWKHSSVSTSRAFKMSISDWNTFTICCSNLMYVNELSIYSDEIMELDRDSLNIKAAMLRNRYIAIRLGSYGKDEIETVENFNNTDNIPRGILVVAAYNGDKKINILVSSEMNCELSINTSEIRIKNSLLDILNNYYSHDMNYGAYGLVDKNDIAMVEYIDKLLGVKSLKNYNPSIKKLDTYEYLHKDTTYHSTSVNLSGMIVYKSNIGCISDKNDSSETLVDVINPAMYVVLKNGKSDKKQFIGEYGGKIVTNVPLYNNYLKEVNKGSVWYMCNNNEAFDMSVSVCNGGAQLAVKGEYIRDVFIYRGHMLRGSNSSKLCRYNTLFRFGLEAYAKMKNIKLYAGGQLENKDLLDSIKYTEINDKEQVMVLYTPQYKIVYDISLLEAYINNENKQRLLKDKDLQVYRAKLKLIGGDAEVDDFGMVSGLGNLGSISTKCGIQGIDFRTPVINHMSSNNIIKIPSLELDEEISLPGISNDHVISTLTVYIESLVVSKKGCISAVKLLRAGNVIIDEIEVDSTITVVLFKELVKGDIVVKGFINKKSYNRLKKISIGERYKEQTEMLLTQLYKTD